MQLILSDSRRHHQLEQNPINFVMPSVTVSQTAWQPSEPLSQSSNGPSDPQNLDSGSFDLRGSHQSQRDAGSRRVFDVVRAPATSWRWTVTGIMCWSVFWVAVEAFVWAIAPCPFLEVPTAPECAEFWTIARALELVRYFGGYGAAFVYFLGKLWSVGRLQWLIRVRHAPPPPPPPPHPPHPLSTHTHTHPRV